MPLIRYQKPQIVVPISDLVMGSTIVKRKARFDSMTYSQSSGNMPLAPGFFGNTIQSPGSVVINLTIQHFATTENGGYGEILDGKRGFSSYNQTLTADFRTLVDAETGEVICDISEFQKVESVLEGGILYNRNFMHENEFFRRLAENVPTIVDDLIEQYIITASDNGTFDNP
jgi:hypothetical protein